MIIVDELVSFAVERLGDLLIEEAKFLYGVRGKVERLQRELHRMQCFLKDMDAMKDRDEVLRNMISEIRQAASDSEDVIDTYALKVASRRSGSSPKKILARSLCFFKEGWLTHNVGSEIDEIIGRISEITSALQLRGVGQSSARDSIGLSQQRLQVQPLRAYSHFKELYSVIGLEEGINSLLGVLLSKKEVVPSVISISGMGGIGKTTLARRIYHHEVVRSHFEGGVAWQTVSQQCRPRQIWEGLLFKLASPEREEISHMKDEEVAKTLHILLRTTKCLVVLDDIWSIKDWDSLSPAFPIGQSESKIILTTRKEKIVSHADSNGYLYQCPCLGPEESWELFHEIAIAGREDKVNKRMKDLGWLMLKNCGGLPLAITVLGGLLRRRHTMEDWGKVHEAIHVFLGKGEGNEEESLGVSKVLAFSYNDLPYRLKPCFLHLSLFPKECEIPRKKLVYMWVAEGFVRDEEEETAEDVAERYLRELANMCMVEVVKSGYSERIKTCRLHDVMRTFCLTEAQNQNFSKFINLRFGDEPAVQTLPSSAVAVDKVRRASIHFDECIRVIEDKERYLHLRSLLYFSTGLYINLNESEQLRNFTFNTCRLLRVLDLENLHVPEGKNLKVIGNLIHLRYLSLRGLQIRELPSSLCYLRCLRVLDLRTIGEVKVPNIISKMEQLRHLYLPESYYTQGNWHMGNLRNLQTLVNIPCEYCNLRTIVQFTNLRKLVIQARLGEMFELTNGELRHLKSLQLDSSFGDEKNVEVLVRICPRIYKLKINGGIAKLPNFPEVCKNLTTLTLHETLLEEDPMKILERLDSLRTLYLLYDSFVGKATVCSKGGFPQLETLVLSGLQYLEELMVDEDAMPRLEYFATNDCHKLWTVSLPQRLQRLLQDNWR